MMTATQEALDQLPNLGNVYKTFERTHEIHHSHISHGGRDAGAEAEYYRAAEYLADNVTYLAIQAEEDGPVALSELEARCIRLLHASVVSYDTITRRQLAISAGEAASQETLDECERLVEVYALELAIALYNLIQMESIKPWPPDIHPERKVIHHPRFGQVIGDRVAMADLTTGEWFIGPNEHTAYEVRIPVGEHQDSPNWMEVRNLDVPEDAENAYGSFGYSNMAATFVYRVPRQDINNG